jgi:para-aminobenzoate synthetase
VALPQIVDLIRADLLSFCLPSSVKVPKLIQVETYDFVHTLVTTVVGQLGEGVGAVEAIGRCFPPGESDASLLFFRSIFVR